MALNSVVKSINPFFQRKSKFNTTLPSEIGVPVATFDTSPVMEPPPSAIQRPAPYVTENQRKMFSRIRDPNQTPFIGAYSPNLDPKTQLPIMMVNPWPTFNMPPDQINPASKPPPKPQAVPPTGSAGAFLQKAATPAPAANVPPVSEPMGPRQPTQFFMRQPTGEARYQRPGLDAEGQPNMRVMPAGVTTQPANLNDLPVNERTQQFRADVAGVEQTPGARNVKAFFDAGTGKSMVVADPNNTLGVNSEVQAPVNLLRNPGNQQQADQSAAALASPMGQAITNRGVLRATPEEVNLLSRMRGGIPPGSYSPKDRAAQAESRNRLFQTADEANTRQQRLAEIAAQSAGSLAVEEAKGKSLVGQAEQARMGAETNLAATQEGRREARDAQFFQQRMLQDERLSNKNLSQADTALAKRFYDIEDAVAAGDPSGPLRQLKTLVESTPASSPMKKVMLDSMKGALTTKVNKLAPKADNATQKALFVALGNAGGDENDPTVIKILGGIAHK